MCAARTSRSRRRAWRDPIRVLIVDDEPLARDCIRIALEPVEGVEVVGECEDGETAVGAIDALAPDLVFLDVQMPGLDGFGVVERIGAERMPPTIFVTAYDEHALRAFEVHAMDYVLKPFDNDRLRAALGHVRRRLEHERVGAVAHRVATLLGAVGVSLDGGRPPVGGAAGARGPWLRRLQVPIADRIRFVAVEDIDWLEAAGNYVRVHCGDESYLVRATLRGLQERLDPERFVRIHRSTIVNVDRVREVEPWAGGDYAAFLRDGRRLRVSRTYRDALLG